MLTTQKRGTDSMIVVEIIIPFRTRAARWFKKQARRVHAA